MEIYFVTKKTDFYPLQIYSTDLEYPFYKRREDTGRALLKV